LKLWAKIILAGIIGIVFVIRHHVCEHYFPEMKTVTGDWDGSNTLTMNCYAVIIGLALIIARISSSDKSRYVLDFSIGVSLSDLYDRYTGVYVYRESEDKTVILFGLAIVLIDFIIYGKNTKLHSSQ
jgi:hypothetical protein